MANVEQDLAKITKDWSTTIVVRTYQAGDKGEAAFASEAEVFAAHGYRPTTTSTEGSHLHAGRLLLTGGLSIFAGRRGIRSKGKLTVTFEKVPEATSPAPDLAEQIRRLADLMGSGLLTQEEFDAKKADLLSRM